MQIQAYLYSNIIEAQIWDLSIFTPRNRPVYCRPLKIYQGIDNPMQVVIRNQDQKLANVTGYAVQIDIQDPLSKGSVQSLAVTMTDLTKGLGTVTIPKDVVNVLEQRIYKLTIKLTDLATNADRPLYVDDNFTAPIDIEVLPGWYESMPLTLSADEVIDAGTIK